LSTKSADPKSADPKPAGPAPDTERTRPLRSDAIRNRSRVLAAAEEVFAAQGVDVPVDVIAERAGVGVGTLYRHFPTTEALFEAILVERVAEIAADARERLGAEDHGAAFFGFLEYLVSESSRKRDLINAFAVAGVELEVVAAAAKHDLQSAVTDLLHEAQRADAVRSDVTAPLVLSLVGAACSAVDHIQPGTSPSEMLAVVCDGLRTQGTPR